MNAHAHHRRSRAQVALLAFAAVAALVNMLLPSHLAHPINLVLLVVLAGWGAFLVYRRTTSSKDE